MPLGPSGVDNDFGYGRLDVLAAYQWLVVTPDFTVSVSPSSATTAARGAVSYSVTIAGVNGFTGDVSLSLAGLSGSQAAWSFDPPVVPGGAGMAQLTVTTTAAIAPGTYPLTVAGTSGSTTRTAAANLVIPPPPDFSLGAAPSSQTVDAGGAAAYTVTVGSLNGFTGSVSLSATGSPPGSSTTFTVNPVGTPGTSTLRVKTTASTTRGTFTLQITGTNGQLVHQATVTLVVR